MPKSWPLYFSKRLTIGAVQIKWSTRRIHYVPPDHKMSPGKKHPHIEIPSIEQLASLLENKTPSIRELYLDVHRLVLETLPDVIYSVDCKDGMLGYGARQYGYNGWGMAALSAHSKWVSLMFMLGVKLEDSDGLLEGTGKKMRHVKIHSPEQVKEKRSALQALIEAASKLSQ